MDIATMASYFDLLQDKYGSTYYTDLEKSLLLQRAQIQFVKELLPTEPNNPLNLELSQDTISEIAPLIYELPYVNMSSLGVITKSSIGTALNTAVTGGILWRPLSIGWELGVSKLPISYVRHNDIWKFYANAFKKPTVNNPKVRETASSYVIAPVSTSAKIYFTVLKYPVEVDIATDVSSDLPDHTHDKIVAIALELTGVASRDAALAQLLQLKKNG